MFLQAQGWQVFRFWNNDVLNNLDGVLSHIEKVLNIPLPANTGVPSPMQGEG